MKKQYIYIIISVLFLIIFVSGATYSYFVSSVTAHNALNTKSTKLEVIYTGGTEINSPIKLGKSKDDGAQTTVHIRIKEGTPKAKATLFIHIELMTQALSQKAFKWEVVGVQNGTQVYNNSGDFEGANATTNNIVNIVEDYLITKEDTTFTIYLWLDGNMAGNEVLNASFKGYIGAKTDNFTAAIVN